MVVPDRGETNLRKWALKRNGDPISNRDIVELVFSFDDDINELFDRVQTSFDEHCAEAKKTTRAICVRLDEVEKWQEHRDAAVTRLFQMNHHEVHSKHMEEFHPLDDQHRTWLVRIVLKNVWAIVFAAIVTAINLLLHYGAHLGGGG